MDSMRIKAQKMMPSIMALNKNPTMGMKNNRQPKPGVSNLTAYAQGGSVKKYPSFVTKVQGVKKYPSKDFGRLSSGEMDIVKGLTPGKPLDTDAYMSGKTAGINRQSQAKNDSALNAYANRGKDYIKDKLDDVDVAISKKIGLTERAKNKESFRMGLKEEGYAKGGKAMARHNKLMHPGQKSKLMSGGKVQKYVEGGEVREARRIAKDVSKQRGDATSRLLVGKDDSGRGPASVFSDSRIQKDANLIDKKLRDKYGELVYDSKNARIRKPDEPIKRVGGNEYAKGGKVKGDKKKVMGTVGEAKALMNAMKKVRRPATPMPGARMAGLGMAPPMAPQMMAPPMKRGGKVMKKAAGGSKKRHTNSKGV